MRTPAARRTVAYAAALLAPLGACATRPSATMDAIEAAAASTAAIEQAYAVRQPPGNLTITPDGRAVMSLHQYFNPVRALGEIAGADEQAQVHELGMRGGGIIPLGLAAVLGVRSDTAGVLHILDNGNTSAAPPKMVLWDTRADRMVRQVDLDAATDSNSFINDLAFDYRRNHVYISDPAGGPNAAIIVVDMNTGRARRVLVGHSSVVPEDFTFAVEGITPTTRMPDGTTRQPRIGVDGIGIDYGHEWVYYGPLHGRTMYRVRAADLANAAMSASDLAGRVERYASKPPSDGIVLDEAGNIYLGDLPNNAFGVITAADRQYRELARGDQYKWVDDFEFGPDGSLYVITTQLHRSPTLNAGKRVAMPPWRVFRTRPLAMGRQGY